MGATKFSDLYRLQNSIDFAKGYYARVFQVRVHSNKQPAAFKVLRPEHVNKKEMKEYKAFGLEVRLLCHFAGCKSVVELLDCGFISDGTERPNGGEVISFGTDAEAFNAHLTEFRQSHWRPYICETLMPEHDNLFIAMRENIINRRYRLPTEEGLAFSLQYADLLQKAHTDNIVYLDVKLEHMYWDGEQLCIIDWNSSKQLNDGDSYDEEPASLKRKDIRSFVIGVMYPIFTGRPPKGEHFREQPSNSKGVVERYNDIDALEFSMEPSLSQCLTQFIQAAAAGEYHTIEQFKNDLENCAYQHGWPMGQNHSCVSAPLAHARDHIRGGLRALRQAQMEIQQAKAEMLNAGEIDDPIIEKETERLIELINKLWEHRVIP